MDGSVVLTISVKFYINPHALCLILAPLAHAFTCGLRKFLNSWLNTVIGDLNDMFHSNFLLINFYFSSNISSNYLWLLVSFDLGMRFFKLCWILFSISWSLLCFISSSEMLSSSPFNKNTLLFLQIQFSAVHIISCFIFVLIDSIFCFRVSCFMSTMDSNSGLISFEIIEPWFSISSKLLFQLSANVDMGWVGVIGYNFIEIPTPRIGFWLRTETIIIIFRIFTTLHILLL